MAQYQNQAQGAADQYAYSEGDIARGQAGLNISAQQNGLGLDQTISQINYGMQQAGIQGQQTADQLYGQLGSTISQGATAEAGVLGYGALLGGVNLNGALSGG
jgi:hypothetical protein